ncbi:hypothetical protein [uncultured Roseobacter sp.]|nr:hypothetical protein [uncultured Roseobacter sp.]
MPTPELRRFGDCNHFPADLTAFVVALWCDFSQVLIKGQMVFLKGQA